MTPRLVTLQWVGRYMRSTWSDGQVFFHPVDAAKDGTSKDVYAGATKSARDCC